MNNREKGRGQRPHAIVTMRSAAASTGLVRLGGLSYPCRVGRSGVKALKREGDGASPRGAWAITGGYYRADRLMRPRSAVELRRMRPQDGWCDAAGDRNYNRFVPHPYPASAERLWRNDHVYDVVLVLDYNIRPRVQGRGSAIFLHMTNARRGPTAGCIALDRAHLLALLPRLRRGTRFLLGGR